MSEAVNVFTRTVARGVIDRVVMPARKAATTSAPSGDRHSVLKQLYKALIEKLEPYLPAGAEDKIVIVPDGSLYLVPFAALIDTEGRYLVERRTMSFVPSLSIYALLRQKALSANSSGPAPRLSLATQQCQRFLGI